MYCRIITYLLILQTNPLAEAPRERTTGIEGSKHDFSRLGLGQGELCLPCHTPHDAAVPQAGALWDHQESQNRSIKLFQGRPGQAGPGTLMCLSCHDGSTAVDAFGGRTGHVRIHEFSRELRSLIGAHGDLSSDHPVGIPYPEHDRTYRSRAEVEADGLVTLPNGQVECTSCHDVHNHFGHEKMLVKSNERSALCLTCHRK